MKARGDVASVNLSTGACLELEVGGGESRLVPAARGLSLVDALAAFEASRNLHPADRFPYGADVSPQTWLALCQACEDRGIPLGFSQHNEIEIAGVKIYSRPGAAAGKLWPRTKP